HDDQIHGRFHSNSQILLGWDRKAAPRFLGKVTTVGGYRIVGGSRARARREIFPHGVDTRAPRVAMRRLALLQDVPIDAGGTQQHRISRDALVIFHADGTASWRDVAGGVEQRASIGQQPLLLLANDGVTLHVRGTVRGAVLVYSPRRIVITGDLRYATDVRGDPSSGDYLGLVSDGSVDIADSDVTGPGDLTVEAAIYARREFAVRDLYSAQPGVLAIYGSVSAGTVTATEPRYATRYEFDARFERLRPPAFPVTDRYELDPWDGRWLPLNGTAD
ncbi:MAG: hypothetical protein NZM12_02235, partial [Steroidobacteraceae bacterium]|nr:hypothetical protein [Steroidobacteraceae bacterium]MDW8259908.1 hypothetical protein [Gammaproteobacteria bacterium]